MGKKYEIWHCKVSTLKLSDNIPFSKNVRLWNSTLCFIDTVTVVSDIKISCIRL
jgi:hypothetical protein